MWLPSRISCAPSASVHGSACRRESYFLEVVGDKGLASSVGGTTSLHMRSAYCCLALVQLHAACQSALGKQAQLRDDELVEL